MAMLKEPRVTPTILKWTARSFKDPAFNGNSGLVGISTRVRQLRPELVGTDREVVLAYFNSLNKPSTPRVKGLPRHTEPVVTERQDFSGVSRDPEIAPWEE
jgi:hypothetical protein